MKRKPYTVYFDDDEHKTIKESAISHRRTMSEFIRAAALAEAGKHIDRDKKKSIYQRLEAIEKVLLKNRI